jgi:exosortase
VTEKPAAETIRSAGWLAALAAIAGTLAFVYFPLLRYCFDKWLQPDYAHGLLVPVFSVYLAWMWRDRAPARIKWPEPWGLAFLAGGVLVFVAAGLTNVAQEWIKGFSLVLDLCGAALLLGGWKALRWLWPSLAFLLFMFPLPYRVEHTLGWQLQKVAALASEFVLQTIGYPTYREGVVLHVQDHTLEVEKACSGLSMLLSFVAISVGMVLVVKRPWLDRVLVLASAVPIAVFCNVVRIVVTGILYNEAGRELGDRVFHDLAGWLMLVMALVGLWLELRLIDWLMPEDLGKASREDVIKMNNRQPAHLFMVNFPEAQGGKPPPAAAGDPPRGPGR